MSGRKFVWFVTLVMLTLLVVVSAPAFPQGAPALPVEEASVEIPAAQGGEEAVESILQRQEELLRGQRFAYEPSGRRDPFRSLFEAVQMVGKGPRPRGIAGMLVTEIDLTGIVRDVSGGDMALVTGTDNKGYFLRVGDEVYDGTIITVDARVGAVTFRQQVDDPRLIKPYRDVVKRLVPLEDEESSDE